MGNLFIATISCPENNCYVLKDLSFPIAPKYIDFARQTKTNLDSVEKRSFDDFCNIDEHRSLFENWSGPARFRILNWRPFQSNSWVDGRLNKTQVTSRPGTSWPEVWSSVSECAQKKARQQSVWKKRNTRVHVRRGMFTIFLPTK